ncbi:hypothetical protein [Sphingobium sp. BS19]|uniref:hypothetical protein n=1 Tax=Sphingobium sp. BS19 TaxID=3018973 RepID=UPI002492F035|nr:hypothetical protein [Sphingobium sp. BS19]
MSDRMHYISPKYFRALCDDTGIFQHAVLDTADRAHGYCIDDNARALLASYSLAEEGEDCDAELLGNRFVAFIQYAWNPDQNRFRNFMGFNRNWLEPQGSEDSHGRTLWALGVCSRDDPSPLRREWARLLLQKSYPAMATFRSPRAWAFAILGLCAFEDTRPGDPAARRMCDRLTGQLFDLLEREEHVNWSWFEDVLAYDNARLPQALLTAGHAHKHQHHIEAGVRSLNWLLELQKGETGLFRPVGSDSFGAPHARPEPFDQQPLEVAATVAACRIAYVITAAPRYLADANRAWRWLLGDNDLGLALLDPKTGRCSDGLHPDRVNANCGAESVVSALLAAADMNALQEASRLAEAR